MSSDLEPHREEPRAGLRPDTTILLLLIFAPVLLGAAWYLFAQQFGGVISRGQNVVALDRIGDLRKAIEFYHRENGEYPDTLRALTEPTPENERGLISKVPLDPWDREFVYRRRPSGDPPYRILSTGPDGVEGTDDDVIPSDLR